MSLKKLFEAKLPESEISEGKFKNAGGGYIENLINRDEFNTAVDELTTYVYDFILESEEWAESEGISTKKQKKMIIDDVLAHIDFKLS